MAAGKNIRRRGISLDASERLNGLCGSELEELYQADRLEHKRAVGMVKRRLFTLPGLLARADEMKEELEDLQQAGASGTPEHSMSIALAVRPGMRISKEEAFEKQVELLKKRLTAARREIARVKRAMAYMESDEYYRIIPEHYMKQKTFEEIAEILNCSVATVYRNHTRLIEILAARLYGA